MKEKKGEKHDERTEIEIDIGKIKIEIKDRLK